MRRTVIFVSLIAVLALLLAACAPAAAPASTTAPAPTNPDLILATTTSTQDSGLLDVLLPVFQTASGYNVKLVAVGTGQALKMGEEGNADVLLVHAPASERTFMENGFGSQRTLVMHNDYIIAGPKDDPAGVKGMTGTVDALKKIAESQSTFVSRGDDSGTHKMELSLWKKAELTPAEADAWYLQSGQGMGATLKIAAEKNGYTLTDRATYLANKDTLGLDVLLEGDAALLNIYHVIIVNPEKWPRTNVDGAKAFAAFLVSAEGQEIIGKFGTEKYGQPLFTPDAGKDPASLGL